MKKILLVALFAMPCLAHADIPSLPQNLIVNCQGTEGSLHLEKTAADLNYQISSPVHALSGSVPHNSDDGQVYVSDFASTLTPNGLTAVWLDIGFQKGHYVWKEKSTGCRPTRASRFCAPMDIPAHFERQWTDYVSINLDVTNLSDIKFLSIDLSPGPGIKTLGENTQCTVIGL